MIASHIHALQRSTREHEAGETSQRVVVQGEVQEMCEQVERMVVGLWVVVEGWVHQLHGPILQGVVRQVEYGQGQVQECGGEGLELVVAAVQDAKIYTTTNTRADFRGDHRILSCIASMCLPLVPLAEHFREGSESIVAEQQLGDPLSNRLCECLWRNRIKEQIGEV